MHPSTSLYNAIHRIIFQCQHCALFTHLYAVLHNFSAKWCSNGVPDRVISTWHLSLLPVRRPRKIDQFRHLFCSVVIACVGVDIQRDACIGVSPHILQRLDIHSRICHVGAEGMPEHMRRDVRQRCIRVQLAILFHRPAHLVLDVQCHLRVIVLSSNRNPL